MKDIDFLLNKAREVITNSYSIYSEFKVGCAILLDDNNVICGTNIENCSYSLSMCAERIALYNAYSQGYKKENIKSILVYADTDNISCCGACRQVIVELMKEDANVYLSNGKSLKTLKVKDLLSDAFMLKR